MMKTCSRKGTFLEQFLSQLQGPSLLQDVLTSLIRCVSYYAYGAKRYLDHRDPKNWVGIVDCVRNRCLENYKEGKAYSILAFTTA